MVGNIDFLLIVHLQLQKIGGIEPLFYYFFIYSFFGWMLENVYSKFTVGIFWKEGFLKGPFKPMYGLAPLLLLLLINENSHWIVIISLCFIIPTVVEYITGFLLRYFFQQMWWDYSHHTLQLGGLVSMSFSICWLFLSIIFIYILHPYIAHTYEVFSPLWGSLIIPFFIYFIIDSIWTIKSYFTQSSPTVN